jgi:glutamyl-tRNA synthetase
MKDATRKLSKRYGDANFDDFIKKGFLSEAIVNYIALLGWSPKTNVEKMNMNELIEHFAISGVNRSSSIFDEVKMRWLNSQYIKELSKDKFNELAEPFYKISKIYGKYDCKKFAPLLIQRIEILSEIPDKINFLDEYNAFSSDLYFNKKLKTDKEIAKPALVIALDYLKGLKDWNIQSINEIMEKASVDKEMKKGIILWSLRVAVSGKEVTPGGSVELMDILGKEESIRRINFALDLLK